MDNKLDIGLKEDLIQALLHLTGIEHHASMSYAQSKKNDWLELKDIARKMRSKYLSKIVKENNQEGWCISKHLLSSSLALDEVATRLNSEGKLEEAKEVYEDSGLLLGLFFVINDINQEEVK